MASPSSRVSASLLRPLSSPVAIWFMLPGTIKMRFDPMLCTWPVMAARAPSPTESSPMTAPVPMMMPSMVSMLRSLLARRLRSAMERLSRIVMPGPPVLLGRPPAWRPGGWPRARR